MAYATDQKVVNVGGLKTFWNKVKQLLNGKVDKETGKGLLSNNWLLLFQNARNNGSIAGTTQYEIPANLHEALIVYHVDGSVIAMRLVPLSIDFNNENHPDKMYENGVHSHLDTTQTVGAYRYVFNTRILNAQANLDTVVCSVFVR